MKSKKSIIIFSSIITFLIIITFVSIAVYALITAEEHGEEISPEGALIKEASKLAMMK